MKWNRCDFVPTKEERKGEARTRQSIEVQWISYPLRQPEDRT